MADYTPNPPQLCPFQPQSTPSAIVTAGPPPVRTGLICSSRCPLFVILTDPQGRPTGGKCAFALSAVALVNFEQGQRAMMQAAAAAEAPSTPTN